MEQYDYIVVGAGSAGCVLANRLSANKQATVLVLEAGKSDRHPFITIPAGFSKLFKSSRDWEHQTEPEPHLENRQLYVPRGKVVGGSSSINAMIYIRGNRKDFDDWSAAGCTGWSYQEVLPYFKRSEGNTRLEDKYHNSRGELTIDDSAGLNVLSQAFIDACTQAGIPETSDFNGESQLGAGAFQVNQRNGRRWSAANAFLNPIKKRENVTVMRNVLVHKLEVKDGKVASVEYSKSGRTKRASASEEILLSAGAISTPKILMLSGIGPAEHLTQMGLPVIADLPVGEGLQDHPAVPVIHDCTQSVSMDDIEHPKHLVRYLASRKGPLRSNISEVGAFIRTDDSVPFPDVQYHFGPLFFADHGFTKRKGNAFSIGPTLVEVESRGKVVLRSKDPSDPVSIRGNYLSAEADMNALVAGVRTARDIASQEAFKPYRGDELFPGNNVTSEEDLKTYIRSIAEVIYHPVGTCSMGPNGEAVVDPALRVNGIENLRVVDASVMPKIVRGNTNAATIMIAEKAADLVLGAAS